MDQKMKREMTVTGRVARNTAFLLAARLVGQAMSLVATVIIARRLTQHQFGVFAFAQSFPQLFLVIADLGLEGLMVRELAVNREQAREYIGKLIPLKALLMAAALAATLIALAASDRGHDKTMVAVVLTVYTLGRSVITFLISLFRGYEEMEKVTLITIVEYAFACVLMYIAVRPGDSAMRAAEIYVVALCMAIVVTAWLVVGRIGVPKLSVDPAMWKKTLAASWPLALGSVAVLFGNNMSIVMLEFFNRGEKEVAGFRVCVVILGIIGYVQNSLAWSVYPVFSRLYVSEKEALKRSYEVVFKATTIIGLPFCAGGAALAAPLLGAVFGESYKVAATCFMIMCASGVITNYVSFFAVFSAAIHRQFDYTIIYFACTALSIALNFVLIPLYGIEGAAVSALAGNVILIALSFFRILRQYHSFADGGFIVKTALALCLMSSAAILMRRMSIYVSIPAAGAVYCAAVLALKPWTKDDITLMKRALAGR